MIFKDWKLTDLHGEYTNSIGEKKWWTELLLDNCYDLVKDHKYPILIPSYINPSSNKEFIPPAIKGFLSKMDENFNYPIILFVRDSQKQQYIDANNHPYVTIVSMQDNLIDSAGKARKESLKWLYNNGYSHAFSFDDDAIGIGITKKGFTGKGDPKSEAIKNIDNIAKVLAVWQYAMEIASEKFNVGISGIYPCGYGWKAEYCWMDESILLYRGNINQLVCLDVKRLIENEIVYYDNKVCGHEDIDLILQCLDKGVSVCTFPFINYSTPPMDCANFSIFGSTMKDRFKAQQSLMIDKYGKDYPYATFRQKKDLDQVVVNFRRYRKDNNINKYIYNLFEGLLGNMNTKI